MSLSSESSRASYDVGVRLGGEVEVMGVTYPLAVVDHHGCFRGGGGGRWCGREVTQKLCFGWSPGVVCELETAAGLELGCWWGGWKVRGGSLQVHCIRYIDFHLVLTTYHD